jgi:hypothetical protein
MRLLGLVSTLVLAAAAAGCGSSGLDAGTSSDASADGSDSPGTRVPGVPGPTGGTGGSGNAGTGGTGGSGGATTGGSGGASGSGGVSGSGGASGTGGGSGGTGGVMCGPTCAIYCPYGNIVDDKGCPTCGCKPAPVCPALGCAPMCPNGVLKDANGCDTCQCAPPPGDACTPKECGPAPGAPNYLCPDGKTVAGPACRRTSGTCGWVFVMCPAQCVQTVLCIRGSHWDPSACKCVPEPPDGGTSVGCACSDGGVCVRQIGGPAIPVDPPTTCDKPVTGCDAGSACDCLPPKEGKCHADPQVAGLCICDNGVR